MVQARFSNCYDPIEISDPLLELGHLRNLTFHSPALAGRGDVSVYVPPQCAFLNDVPLVVLLHGVYSSHWAWFMIGGAHLTAHRLIDGGSIRPMVIAAPSDGLSGDSSGYLPFPGSDYERWISDDVVGCVRQMFPCLGLSSPTMISGFSMGGYGALRLGMKYPERFRAISAHSSITHVRQLEQFTRHPMRDELLAPQEADLLYWARLHAHSLPPLRFDCGHEDSLRPANAQLHRELNLLGIEHEYVEYNGAHSWDYWKIHLIDTLLFFEQIAGLPSLVRNKCRK